MFVALSSYHFLPIFFDMDSGCQISLVSGNKSHRLNFILDSGCELNLILDEDIAKDLCLVFDEFSKILDTNTASCTLKIDHNSLKIDIPIDGIMAVPKVSTIKKFNAIIGLPILHQLIKYKICPGEVPPSKNIKFIPFASSVEFPDRLYLETKKGTKFTCIIDTGSYGSYDMEILPHVYEIFKKEKMIKLSAVQITVESAVPYQAQKGITNKIALISSNNVYNFKNLRTNIIVDKNVKILGYDIMLNYNFICLLSDNHSVIPAAHQI